MTAFLKAAAAIVLGSVVAGAAFASSAMERAFDLSAWSEDCALPSATASSPITRAGDVQLASDNQPVSAASDSANQNSCSSCTSCPQSDCCSQCACCCCPPLWYVSAGTVILHRDRPDAGAITAADPSLTPFSTGRDFDFGWNAGPDITLGRHLANGDSIEGRFFDDDGAEGTLSFRTPGSFVGPGFFGPPNTLITARYLTQLYSSELNYRHQLTNRIDFLTGFRWIELSDDLRYNIAGGAGFDEFRYDNHLYGAQVGADWALTDHCSRLQLSAVGKAGLYGNVTDGGTYVLQVSNPPSIKFTGDDTTTAFVGELNFTAAYWLTNHMAIRGGYQLLWLDNLALSADAAARSMTDPTLLTKIENDGHLFYNGATAGIDFVW